MTSRGATSREGLGHDDGGRAKLWPAKAWRAKFWRAHPWRRLLAPLLLSAALCASAQTPATPPASLLHLLSAESVLVLDLRDGAALGELLDPFIELWSDAEVGRALAPLLGNDLGRTLDAWGSDLSLRTLISREALLALSITPFNPIPALTLIARVDEATGERLSELIVAAVSDAEGRHQQLREGAIDFAVLDRDAAGLAVVRYGDLLALSSQSDALRTLLRLLQGSGEATFLSRPGVAEALAELGPGTLTGFFDADPLVRALAPLLGGLGFDQSLAKLRQIALSAGPIIGVAELSEDAVVSRGLRLVAAEGSNSRGVSADEALRALLLNSAPAPRAALPSGAAVLSLQLLNLDPRALWAYLAAVARELPEWGVPDLNRTVRDLLGVDLSAQLFDFTTPGVLLLQLEDPNATLFGGVVIGLHIDDAAATEAGLRQLLDALGSRLTFFIDPFGAGAAPLSRELPLHDSTLLLLDVVEGVTLAAAVQGGIAYLATSEHALRALLSAATSEVDADLSARLSEVPLSATSLRIGDTRSALEGWRALLLGQLPSLLQLIVATESDEVALVHAAEAIDRYLLSITPLLGRSVTWSEVGEGGRIRSTSRTERPQP